MNRDEFKATHVFHKITLHGSACKFSARFRGNPLGSAGSLATLLDAERIDSRGRSYPVTEKQRQVLMFGPWSSYHKES